MNWKKEAVSLLTDYSAKQEAMSSLKERYRMLDAEMKSLRAGQSDKIPLKGDLSRAQDRLINSIAEKEQLKQNYAFVRQQLNWIDRGLSVLEPNERMVLEGFYISAGPRAKDDLMDALCIERSALYELKDRALRKFTMSMYGLLES